MATVFVDGGAGTTGLEIRERLAGRDDLSVLTLPEERRKDAAARAEALNDADFVILCLPDDAAREAVALIRNPRTRVIDASTAHRTDAAWCYGFAELEPARAAEIAAAARVSNPGCYPTGFLALVRPLVRAGLIATDAALSTHAVSGYSGGGRAMIEAYEGGAASSALRGYGLAQMHKHLPEMQVHAGLARAPIFTPAVAPTYRGMIVSVPLPGTEVRREAAEAALREAYADQPLVRVAPPEDAMSIEADAGTDRMTLRACGRDGAIVLVATLDNLGKGAAGAAVQNLNLMAGLPATAGLIL